MELKERDEEIKKKKEDLDAQQERERFMKEVENYRL